MITLNKESRVITWSRPYYIGNTSVKHHKVIESYVIQPRFLSSTRIDFMVIIHLSPPDFLCPSYMLTKIGRVSNHLPRHKVDLPHENL